MNAISERLVALLRRSEKYTKTDMVYLAKGGFWLSFGSGAAALASFLLSIAFANLISPESYGVYKYILSLAAVFGAFTLTGLETAVVQATSRGKEGVLKKAFWVNILWSLPMTLVATVGALYYGINGNIPLAAGLFLIGFMQPFITSAALAGAYVNGKKLFHINGAYYAMRTLVPAAALVIAMVLTHNPLVLIVVNFVANLVVALLMYLYVLVGLKPNKEDDPSAMTYAKHLSGIGIFMNVADNLDKILTFQMLGAAPLAIYSFALALPQQSKLLTKSLSNLMLPKFAERPDTELRAAMSEKILRFFLLGLVMAVGYILIAPYAFKLIYPQYMEAVFLSQIYAISLIGIAISPINIYLTAKRKIKAQYIISVVTSTFQIISAVAGIMIAGLLGLIASRVATRFLGAILAVFFYYFDRTNDEHV